MKKIIILGSTGSIGRQTLDVIARNSHQFEVTAIACGANVELFNAQIEQFNPKYVFINDSKARHSLVPRGAVVMGTIEEIAAVKCDYVVTAQVGIAGLLPTIAAIKAGNNIALANKETLVCAGDLIMQLASTNNVQILPVDSEHSAIWQCLNCGKSTEVERLILTASGGSFRGMKVAELSKVKAADALKHPTWAMGAKITVDSATLMNKGLEVIEAKHLFGVDIDNIDVVMHRQSIIHSMVQYIDGSVIAQMSYPTMELPIQMAIGYPDRILHPIKRLNWAEIGQLTFEPLDRDTFACLDIAMATGKAGGLNPCIMNAANEIAVEKFIDNKIAFLDIPYYISSVLDKLSEPAQSYNINDVIEINSRARALAQQLMK